MSSEDLVHFVSQALFLNKTMFMSELKKKHDRLAVQLEVNTAFEQSMDATNLALQAIQMSLHRTRDDFSGKWIYTIVTTVPYAGDPKLEYVPADLTRNELLLFKAVIEEFFATDRCTGVKEHQLSTKRPNARASLDKLVELKWLHRPGQASYYPSARAMLELKPRLEESYGGSTLFNCMGCKNMFRFGSLCENRSCNARLHMSCYDSFFAANGRTSGECPQCEHRIPKLDIETQNFDASDGE